MYSIYTKRNSLYKAGHFTRSNQYTKSPIPLASWKYLKIQSLKIKLTKNLRLNHMTHIKTLIWCGYPPTLEWNEMVDEAAVIENKNISNYTIKNISSYAICTSIKQIKKYSQYVNTTGVRSTNQQTQTQQIFSQTMVYASRVQPTSGHGDGD